jgi:uncharacterized protein YuzE
MKLHYYAETDSLYIEFQAKPGSDSVEIAPGVVADFAQDGSIVGLDIDHASKKLDLSRLEAFALPVVETKIA